MSIRETIESTRFPVHKSGGYQVAAVDEVLVTVLAQAAELESAVEAETARAAQLSAEVDGLKAEVGALTAEVSEVRQLLAAAEARAAEVPQTVEVQVPVVDDSAVADLQARVDELSRDLTEVREQAKADEEHIAALETYADEVESRAEGFKAERDKIRSDAEVALAALAERLKAAQSAPVSPAVAASMPKVTEETETFIEVTEPAPTVDVQVEAELEPHEVPEPKPLAFSPSPSPAPEATNSDDDEASGEHQHTPSITTPVTKTEESTPTRPRLLRRG